MEALTNLSDNSLPLPADDALFGWDPTPGIVSVWARRSGKAWVWQRIGDRVNCTRATFRPWLFATTLDDLTHLGSALQPKPDEAAVSYRVLDGPDGLVSLSAVRTRWAHVGACAAGWGIAAPEPAHHVALSPGRHLLSCWPRRTIPHEHRSGLLSWDGLSTTCIACSSISKRPPSIRHEAASSSSPFAITGALNRCWKPLPLQRRRP